MVQGLGSTLQFDVQDSPENVTHIRVELMPDDTYTMTALRVDDESESIDTVSTHEQVYCDQLLDFITACTGLLTVMPLVIEKGEKQ